MAQTDINPNEYQEEIPVLLKREYTVGLNVHSNGWGLLFRRAKNITVAKKMIDQKQLNRIFLEMKRKK